MGFSVKSNTGKRGWKLLSEKNEYDPAGNRSKRCTYVGTGDFGKYGFRDDMTIEQARARASALNRVSEEKRHAQRRVSITKRLESESLSLAFAVPEEDGFLPWCTEENQINLEGDKKLLSHWQCAKRLVAALRIEPKDYWKKRLLIYKWFADHQLSLGYAKKVLRFVNLYGTYTAELHDINFKPVPSPKQFERQRINNAHRAAKKPTKKSKPVSFEQLESSRLKWKPEQYNWMYLSLWLGLRPEEVDNLSNPELHRWSRDANGVVCLEVYQTKLEETLDEEHRWKHIPLLYIEQELIPELIKSGAFERPLVKIIRDRLGPGYGTYAGRKGFEELMDSRGQPFHFVSLMLGHQRPDITFKRYMNRTKARYVLPEKHGAKKKAA